MTIAVVPVKELGAAKGRLSARLAPRERRELVLAMLEDVLTALSETRGLSGVIVVSREPEIASMASRFRAEVLEEPIHPGDGYTHAVEHAIKELDRRGEPAVLTVPGDVPAVTPAGNRTDSRRGRRHRGRPGAFARRARHQRRPDQAARRASPALRRAELRPSPRARTRARPLRRGASASRACHSISTPPRISTNFLRTPSPTRTYRLLSGQIRP